MGTQVLSRFVADDEREIAVSFKGRDTPHYLIVDEESFFVVLSRKHWAEFYTENGPSSIQL